MLPYFPVSGKAGEENGILNQYNNYFCSYYTIFLFGLQLFSGYAVTSFCIVKLSGFKKIDGDAAIFATSPLVLSVIIA